MMKKRIFSILLALALCVGLLPVTAWADDATTVHTTYDTDKTVSESTPLTSGIYGPATGHATITLSGSGKLTIASGQTVTLRNRRSRVITGLRVRLILPAVP